MRSSRALGQFPFVPEQVCEVVVAPLRWRRGPDHFQPAADRVIPFARAKFAPPAEALLLKAGGLGLWADVLVRICTAVGFAERVPPRAHPSRLLLIPPHAPPPPPDVP